MSKKTLALLSLLAIVATLFCTSPHTTDYIAILEGNWPASEGRPTPETRNIDTFPYVTDFEDTVFPPLGWALYDLDFAQPQWSAGDSVNHTPGGTHSAGHNKNASQDQDGWLVSPALEIPLGGFTLSFWSLNSNQGAYGSNSVLISTGSADPADEDFIAIWSPLTVSASWYQNYVDLSPWNGQTVHIAFRYEGLNTHSWNIDDISFAEFHPINEFPHQENFESGIFPPYYWRWFDEDGMYGHWNWEQGTNHTLDGNCSAVHGYVEDEPAQDGWLISPPLTIPVGPAFMVSFWSYNPFNQAYGSNSVLVSPGSLDPANGDYLEVWSSITVCGEWKLSFVDLSPWAGQTIFVAFRYQGMNAHSWYLDDVTFGAYQGIQEFPYAEDFESGVFPPYYWNSYDDDGSGTYWSWNMEPNLNHSEDGICSAMHIWDAQEPAEDGWLVTPQIRVPATGNATMTFWSKNTNPQWYGANTLCVSTTSPEPWAGDYVQIWWSPTVSEEWVQTTVDLSVWAGSSIFLAFRYQGLDAHDWYLDDVVFSLADIDTQAPQVSHLPLINTVRDDQPYGVFAEVVDDPVWNSGVAAVLLYYQVNGGDSIMLDMQAQGGGYYAEIPAQTLNTQIHYTIFASDASPQSNTISSPGYSFWINDPNWIFYHDNIQTSWAGMDSGVWGLGVLFENPYYPEPQTLQINAVSGALMYDDTVSVHLYSCTDQYLANLTEIMDPISAIFLATMGTDVPITGVTTSSPFFYVVLQDINPGNYFTLEDIFYPNRCFLYWNGQYMEFGSMAFYNVWMLSVLVETGDIVIPVPDISIAMQGGVPVLHWTEVAGADLYRIYSSRDPYAPQPWGLYDETAALELGDIAQDPQRFFEVTAVQSGPAKVNKVPALVPLVDKATRLPEGRPRKLVLRES